jgi:UDP-glucose 4-epimerase
LAVLVIGGAGYIGSHTAHVLRKRGYDVIIYDNLATGFKQLAEGFELIVGDFADRVKIQSVLRRCEAVMFFAAHASVGESVENPKKYYHNNVTSAISLLDSVMESRARRFIFSSTAAVYGNPAQTPIT